MKGLIFLKYVYNSSLFLYNIMLIKNANARMKSLPIKKQNYDLKLKSQIISFQQTMFWSFAQNSYYFENTD